MDERYNSEIISIEYIPENSYMKSLTIDALNSTHTQNGKYSFACVEKTFFSRCYHMPTSKGPVTVVVKDHIINKTSQIFITGSQEACEWHKENLKELAEIYEHEKQAGGNLEEYLL